MLTPFLLLGLLASANPEAEALISLDVKDAAAVDVVRMLTEVADFQAVFDPGVACTLTLKLTGVRWQKALDLTLAACGLGHEGEGRVLRIAPAARFLEESAARRRLDEERRLSGPALLTTFHLSYARAEEMAPLLKRWLSPRAVVSYDTRTNTLLVVD
jgi:type IV pilus assembly protein PilQ